MTEPTDRLPRIQIRSLGVKGDELSNQPFFLLNQIGVQYVEHRSGGGGSKPKYKTCWLEDQSVRGWKKKRRGGGGTGAAERVWCLLL